MSIILKIMGVVAVGAVVTFATLYLMLNLVVFLVWITG